MRILRWPAAALLAAGVAISVFAPGLAFADSGRPVGTSATGAQHTGTKRTGTGTQAKAANLVPAPTSVKRDAFTQNSSISAAATRRSKRASAADVEATKRGERPKATAQSLDETGPLSAIGKKSGTTPTADPHSADAAPTKSPDTAKSVVMVTQSVSALAAASTVSSPAATVMREASTAITPAPTRTLLGVVTGLVFGVFTELERLLTGPPTVTAGSTVTVRSSTLQVAGGVVVPADWYYPAGDPPQRMILLQHGFFAIGAMYSDTAATLAEETDSIVVVPTLTSNPFADGGLWVNGVGMQQAIARLFVGDRAALTASALAAGYAQQYGLSAADAVLPTQFVLAGHSAGGALVSGAAGYLVDYGAANDLAGVLLLDAVTTGNELSGALTKLDAYQEQTGRYIPVEEIGSPPNLWNFISNVNATLSKVRPDHFDGVVLSGGVHTDSMGGGSAISEFLVHLLAGFPIAQNPVALKQLSVQWVNDWFAGNTDADDNLLPGTRITIATPDGTAVGTVIGTPAPGATSAEPVETVLAA
jgi:hypothetical protein